MGITVHIEDWYALELAFSFNGAEHRAYLDLRTGAVRTFHSQEIRDAEACVEDPHRLVRIDPIPPSAQYRWMVKFAASIQDGELRARLERALSVPGAFRQFKDVLHASTKEWRRWRTYRAERLQERILVWLTEQDLAPDELPPWQVTGSVGFERSEAYDRLRHIAHEHIGKLSPAGLELALVYLRHVHQRHGTDG